MTAPTGEIAALFRHPVKGFSPEPLADVALTAGAYFPGDRLYAVENGPSGFDPAAPAYRQKTAFLMLMRNARLAGLKTRLDADGRTFHIRLEGETACEADLATPEGRATLEEFLTGFMGAEARGPLKVLAAPEGFRFTDSLRSGFVSLLNLDSVRDLEARMGVTVDPLRFRMNLHVEGWPAGCERALEGRTLQVGEARLQVLCPTERCAAVNVNPVTAARDLNVVKALMEAYGHCDMGIYAKVVANGEVRRDDKVTVLS